MHCIVKDSEFRVLTLDTLEEHCSGNHAVISILLPKHLNQFFSLSPPPFFSFFSKSVFELKVAEGLGPMVSLGLSLLRKEWITVYERTANQRPKVKEAWVLSVGTSWIISTRAAIRIAFCFCLVLSAHKLKNWTMDLAVKLEFFNSRSLHIWNVSWEVHLKL